MSPRRSHTANASRRFFVEPRGRSVEGRAGAPEAPAADWAPGDSVALLDEEEHHALRVIRLRAGDELLGLDGRGSELRLRVRVAERRRLELDLLEIARFAPPPGAPGGTFGAELALALPRPQRLEAMIDRLTQLGLARLSPIVCEHSPEHARQLEGTKLARLERAARESCKQSGTLWLPRIDPPRDLEAVLGATAELPDRRVHLDPRATERVWDWLNASDATRALFFVGPEGGFSEPEVARLEASGARGCRLAPSVLRIETAAELALGLAAHASLEG